eukprot:756528-Hanusia_phi.AAC.2
MLFFAVVFTFPPPPPAPSLTFLPEHRRRHHPASEREGREAHAAQAADTDRQLLLSFPSSS